MPRSRCCFGRCSQLLLLSSVWLAAVASAAEPVPPDHAQRMKEGLELFKKDVRPLLAKHCLNCHGGKSTKGDFDLSDRPKLMESGVVGKNAKSSRLYALITHAEEPFMPHKAEKLNDAALAAIGKWIDLGSPYDKPLVDKATAAGNATLAAAEPKFWSFDSLQVVAPPKVKNEVWAKTAIDRFVLAKQEAKGLAPNPAADRRTLIRRAYFDLLGLPPSPEEIDAFVNDANPLAYERLIEKLLESPHYGERWARHWLDVARFAESHGYEQDYDRPHAFYYRDFLIKAFNADMPYDQFVRWQLAGDELAPDDPLAMTATGFLGGGAFPTQLTEMEFETARYDELDDMASTTGAAVLGLSVGCARCHDHKFDPIAATEYYQFVSSFTTAIRSEIDLTLEPNGKPVKAQVTSEGVPKMKHHADDRGFPHFYPETHILQRGDVHQKKAVATQDFIAVLKRNGKDVSHWKVIPPEGWTKTSFRRATLANWITDSENGAGHLAARVIVNRLWQHHFGRGLVASPNDFGMAGERPSHPELLDWLATDLIHHGWRLKRLHKLLMTSGVYTQTSQFDEPRATIDRENVWIWRRTPLRLEGEPIRDAMLQVAGLLDQQMFGPGTLDQNMRRRSVYFFIKRSKLVPVMMLFDWPEHLVSIGQRSTTTIAPQALMFMNSPQGRQYADGFAKRLAGKPPEESVRQGHLMAFGRMPTEPEQRVSAEFLARQTASHQQAGKANAAHLATIDFCQTLMSMNEFVYID